MEPSNLLSSERTTFSQSSLTTSWLTQDSGTFVTGNSGLSVGEDGGDGHTTWAFDIQEVRSWGLNQGLQFVFLEFRFLSWVQQIND